MKPSPDPFPAEGPSPPPKKRAKRFSLDALLRGDTRPMVLAASMAVGAFIGFSPAYGFHTLMVLGAVAIFRLNPVATLLGSQVSFGPIIVPVMIGEVWVGDRLRYGHVVPVPKLSVGELARWLWSHALPSWMLGWLVLGTLAGVVTGLLTLGFLRLRARARTRNG
jgi:uncharacterized protein (DUF2062 family)